MDGLCVFCLIFFNIILEMFEGKFMCNFFFRNILGRLLVGL